jgi:anti-repressor protein
MNELTKIFNYKGSQLRTVVKDGQPWFVGKDVCEYFGDTNYRRSLSRLDEDEKGVSRIDTPGGPQSMTVVNESGLYSLLFMMQPQQANLPKEQYEKRISQIKYFKRWITHEVLPSIRKHGAYMTPETIEKVLTDPDTIIKLATALKQEQRRRLEAEQTNAILMHVNKTYTATEIAKEIGFKSATALNRDLGKKRVQYKQNDTWVLYSNHANRGYTEIKQEVLDNGKVIYHRRWTQLGRKFLLDLYREEVAI